MSCGISRMKGIMSLLVGLMISTSAVSDQAEHSLVTIGYWRASLPPYIMIGKDNGIFVDMVKNTFANQRVNTTSQYFPTLEKAVNAMEQGHIDALAMGTLALGDRYYYSDPIFIFNNHAISLRKNHLKIDSKSDLKGIRVIAFPKASEVLDLPELPKQEKGLYREVMDQRIQVDLLFYDKADVVLADKYIFNYYRKQAAYHLVEINSPYRATPAYHKIFPLKAHYNMAFRDIKLRDLFMKGYQKLESEGGINTIRDYYLELMGGL